MGLRLFQSMETLALQMEVDKLRGERDGHKKSLHDHANMSTVKEMHLGQEDGVPGNVDQCEDGAHDDLRVAQLTKEKQDLQAKLAAVESDYNTLNGKFKSMQKRLKSTGVDCANLSSNDPPCKFAPTSFSFPKYVSQTIWTRSLSHNS